MLTRISSRNMSSRNNVPERDCMVSRTRIKNKINKLRIFLPENLEFNLILKKRNSWSRLYLYSDRLCLTVYIPSNYVSVMYDEYTKVITFRRMYYSSLENLYLRVVKNIVQSFVKLNFKKLKFKGKGYYVYKGHRSTVAPQLGYSHRVYLYSWFSCLKFTSKSSLLFFGFELSYLAKISQLFKSLRPVNIFTGRGIRFSRQLLYSKPGKEFLYR
jgi:ribosomal protein L6P/L9E